MAASLGRAQRGRRRGFTLIELLVVVSIIALLVSILLPALSKAREQAKAVVCLSRMKSVALGVALYTHDYDDFLPPAVQPQDEEDPPVPYKAWWWKHLIGEYLEYKKTGNPQVDAAGDEFWQCPVLKPTEDLARYAINERLMRYYGGWRCRPLRVTAVGSPAEKIFAADAYNDHLMYDYYGLKMSFLFPRHAGGTFNLAFLDGHGGALRTENADVLAKIKTGEYPPPSGGFYSSMATLTDPIYWLPE